MRNSIISLRNYVSKTISVTLILGSLISSFAINPNFSNNLNTVVQAAEGNWEDYAQEFNISWYYDHNGSEEDPYLIDSAEALAGLAYLVNNEIDNFEGKTVVLTNNINLQNHYWTPIGLSSYFEGTFDGQGYTIENILISTSDKDLIHFELDYAGLFGRLLNAKIRNVNIGKNSYIHNNGFASGGICGKAENSEIKNCTNNAKITGMYHIGGICGELDSYSQIINCNNYGNICGNFFAGGICCFADDHSKIIKCINRGTVSSDNNGVDISVIGEITSSGICNYAHDHSVISDCTNTGTISSNAAAGYFAGAGGICSFLCETELISNCINTGTVSATSKDSYTAAGGISTFAESEGKIINCVNSGNISSSAKSEFSTSGGICAWANQNSKMINCSNRGAISSTNANKNVSNAGGICGTAESMAMINNCINQGVVCSMSGSLISYAGDICGEERGALISNTYYQINSEHIEYSAERGIGNQADQEGVTTGLPAKQMAAESGVSDGGDDWVDIVIDDYNFGKKALIDALNHGVGRVDEDNISLNFWDKKTLENNDYPYINNTWTVKDENGVYLYADTDWYYDNQDSNVYTISTAEELAGLSALVNDEIDDFEGKEINIKKDSIIDLSEHEWQPIGSKTTPFKGIFNGNGSTINGMHIYSLLYYRHLGLFAATKGAKIIDVNVGDNSYIDTYVNSAIAGGIVGYADENTEIIGCNNNANISSHSTLVNDIGGIAGYADAATISDCNNNGRIYLLVENSWGCYYVGGIVGLGDADSSIMNCNNNGEILSSISGEAAANVGGIIGSVLSTSNIITETTSNTIIENCANFGTVKSICDYLHTDILNDNNSQDNKSQDSNSQDNSEVSDIGVYCGVSNSTGGIIGSPDGTVEITNCMSIGTVKASTSGDYSSVGDYEACTYAGGICGGNILKIKKLKISNCVFGGNVCAATTADNSELYTGGILGCVNSDDIIIENAYYEDGSVGSEDENGVFISAETQVGIGNQEEDQEGATALSEEELQQKVEEFTTNN